MICPNCAFDNIEGVDYCENCHHDLRGLDQPDVSVGPDAGPDFIYHPLSELPAKKPAVVSPSDPVGLAVRLMQNEGTDCVLAMSGNQLAGIITPWDILYKVAGPTEDLNAVSVGQIMTADPIVLEHDEDMAVAINKLAVGGFRHVPVLRGDGLAGVIVASDVFRHISPQLV